MHSTIEKYRQTRSIFHYYLLLLFSDWLRKWGRGCKLLEASLPSSERFVKKHDF